LVVNTPNIEAFGTSKESCYCQMRFLYDSSLKDHIPLPETVILVRDVEDERATNSSVGVGVAKTLLAAASTANVLNPLIFFLFFQILADRNLAW